MNYNKIKLAVRWHKTLLKDKINYLIWRYAIDNSGSKLRKVRI